MRRIAAESLGQGAYRFTVPADLEVGAILRLQIEDGKCWVEVSEPEMAEGWPEPAPLPPDYWEAAE